MEVFREGLRCPMEPAESPRELEIQLINELGEERIRLFRSNCELLESGEMEIGRLCPNLFRLDAVSGLMMPDPSGDWYSRPSREIVELGRLVSSCEMELGVERLGKSGDTIPAYCIRPGEGPAPLRDRGWLPSADSCDLLSPFGYGDTAESLFRRCPPLFVLSAANPELEAHCVWSSGLRVSFSIVKSSHL